MVNGRPVRGARKTLSRAEGVCAKTAGEEAREGAGSPSAAVAAAAPCRDRQREAPDGRGERVGRSRREKKTVEEGRRGTRRTSLRKTDDGR